MKPWAFWRKWTLFCGMGELLGMATAGGAAFAYNALLGEPETWKEKLLNLSIMLVAGAIEGTFVGFFQWQVLRQFFENLKAKAWIGYTVLAGVTGWLLGMLPSTLMPMNTDAHAVQFDPPLALMVAMGIGMGLVLGALFGFFQWIVLRQLVHRAGQWIWANALGWAVGMAFIFLGAGIPDANWQILQVISVAGMAGVFAGAAVGAITGIFLLKMAHDQMTFPMETKRSSD